MVHILGRPSRGCAVIDQILNAKAIFYRFLEEDPADVSGFLQMACGDNPDLRQQVEALIHCHENPDALFEEPPFFWSSAQPVLTGGENCPASDTDFPLQTTSEAPPEAEIQSPLPEIPGHEILRELGRGGMGIVYLARQIRADRLVAVKVLLGPQHVGEEEQRRFRREAEAIARLQHPGIVQIFEVGEHKGRAFFSLEYCSGGNLDQFMSRAPLLPLEAAQAVADLSRSIQAAHDASIVHRDLKPANVLLAPKITESHGSSEAIDAESRPPLQSFLLKITDFGIAKKLDAEAQTKTDLVMGSPSYMAPEQVDPKQAVGPATDVYSLGVILYVSLTGRAPFLGSTSLDTILQLTRADPIPPRRLNPSVPPDLDTICLKCLQKDPIRRYATALNLAEDLERYVQGRPILARPVSRTERIYRWVKRNPLMASLVASLLLVLCAGSGVASWLAVMAQAEKKRAIQARKQAEETAKRESKAKHRAIQEQERAEKLLYAKELELLIRDWKDGATRKAEAALDKTNPFHRGWEHRFLDTWFRRLGRAPFLESPKDPVLCIALSPDGQQMACARGDFVANVRGNSMNIELYDLNTRKVQRALSGHQDFVTCLAFSPNGNHLVSGSRDTTIKIWDLKTGRALSTLRGHSRTVRSVAYSPNGKRIYSGGEDRTLKIWNGETGIELQNLTDHNQPINDLACSPDGKYIASAGGPPTFKVIQTSQGARKLQKTVLTGEKPGELLVWDATTGKKLYAQRDHSGSVLCVTFSPNGKHLLSGSTNRRLILRDARSGKPIKTLQGHSGPVTRVTFSPDGSRVISGDQNGILKVWSSSSGNFLFTLSRHHRAIFSMAHHPDGRRIVTGSGDGSILLWDASRPQSPRRFQALKGKFRSIAVSPNGQQIFFADQRGLPNQRVRLLRALDSRTGKLLLTLKGHTGDVTDLTFSPAGNRLVSCSGDKTIKLWDTTTGTLLHTFLGHKDCVQSVAFSPDGSQIVSGGWDRDIRIWDTISGALTHILPGHTGNVSNVTFSPNGSRIASASFRAEDNGRNLHGEVKVWDATTGEEVFTKVIPGSAVLAVCFSPDGRKLAFGTKDHTVQLVDAETGQELLKPIAHASSPQAVVFTHDGKRIVSGTKDGRIRFWDAKTGILLFSLEGEGPVTSLTFTEDGNRLISGTRGSTIGIWDAFPPKSRVFDDLEWKTIAPTTQWHRGQIKSEDLTTEALIFHLRQLARLEPWRAKWQARLAGAFKKAQSHPSSILHALKAISLHPKVPFPSQ